MGKATYFKHYSSMRDMINDLHERGTNNPTYKSSGRKTSAEWSGSRTYQEAEKLAVQGVTWDRKELRQINALGSKTIIAKAMQGFAPCVANAVVGNPLSMYGVKPKSCRAKTLNVIICNEVPFTTNADSIRTVGKLICQTLQQLEIEGTRINLQVASACEFVDSTSDSSSLFLVDVKRYQQPINPATIGFSIISPAMVRRFEFRFKEKYVNELSPSYGMVPSVAAATAIIRDTTGVKQDTPILHLCSFCEMLQDGNSEDSVKEQIINTLKNH